MKTWKKIRMAYQHNILDLNVDKKFSFNKKENLFYCNENRN